MAVHGAVNEILLVNAQCEQCVFCLTVDGERCRRLCLAHQVLCHAGVGAHIS